MNLLLAGLLILASVEPGSNTAGQPIPFLHPYLTTKLLEAPSDMKVPVYFVIRERLGYEHWFPRVNRLSVDERREVVVRELKEHASKTQAAVLAILRAAELRGEVEDIEINWLGNFVRCRATPAVVVEAAAHSTVELGWYDTTPPLVTVEDGAAVTSAGEGDGMGEGSGGRLIPGNGPLDTRADLVWAFGVTGTGVVVMNTDSGCVVTHSDLASRIWQNPGEIPGNLIDDDGNGKIDDINGWNFNTNTAALSDGGGHGTNTSGCIVADGTCNGTTYGQAPGAKIMIGALGGEATMWAGVQYAIDKGAHCQTSSHSYKNDFNPPPNYRMHRDVGETSLAAGLIRTNSTSNNGSLCNSTTSFNRKPFNISAPGNLPPPYIDKNQTLVGRKGGVLGVAAHTVGTTTLASYSPCGPFAWFLADLLIVRPTYPLANWDSVNDNDYPWTGGTQQALLKPDVSAPTGTTTTSGTAACGTATFSGTSNATPVANGVFCLWKSANPSLKPEDIAMIVHQTSTSTGTVAGKENNFGAGKLDARNGLDLALCVHRVNGEPGWTVKVTGGTSATFELDTLPNASVAFAIGTSRIADTTFGGIIGIAPLTPGLIWFSTSNAAGNWSITFPVPAAIVGLTVFTQCASVDTVVTGSVATPRLLTSNVIGTTVVP